MFVYFLFEMNYFILIDPEALGRCDPSLLPQQARLELLVQDFADKAPFQSADGSFVDVKDWVGVGMDAAGCVERILWSKRTFRYTGRAGSINLRWIPQTMVFLHISGGGLEGSISTEDLPKTLDFLRLRDNQFKGEVNLQRLPPRMRLFDVSNNVLTGSVRLDSLPATLEALFLAANQFLGSVDLTHLPAKLTKINLNVNALSGDIDLSRLPQGLKRLHLQGNNFRGDVNCSNIVQSLRDFQLDIQKVTLRGSKEEVHRVECMPRHTDMQWVH